MLNTARYCTVSEIVPSTSIESTHIMIRIGLGYTRIVIVTGNHAIKIARIHPENILRRLLSFPLLPPERKQEILRKHTRGGFHIALLRIFRLGITANRREYRYYRFRRDARVMPTYRMFLNGLVVLQERGDRVTYEEFRREHPFPYHANNKKIDLGHPGQFSKCRKTGKVLISDYGNKGTLMLLQNSSA